MWKKVKFKFYVQKQAKIHITNYEIKNTFINRLYSKFFRKLWFGFSQKKGEILTFLLVIIVAWSFLQSARLTAIIFQIQKKVFSSASEVNKNLLESKDAIKNQDLFLASTKLSNALEDFNKIDQDAKDFQKLTLGLNKLFPTVAEIKQLISAGKNLSQSAKLGLDSAILAKQMSFGKKGLVAGENLKIINKNLTEIQDLLLSAQSELNSTDWKFLPKKYEDLILDSQPKITAGINSLAFLKNLSALGLEFFSGQKTVLVLLQNNNELRATGGFIGSFADVKIANGRLEKLKLTSVYDIDGQLTEKIVPPEPLLAVNNRWYLRDANWFADFEQSAKKITEFYEKEGGETPNAIIAITPSFFSDILKITGPIKITGNLELNSENLLEQLQILTQSDKADPSNEPKKFLSELLEIILAKLETLPQGGSKEIIKIVQKNLENKNLILYSKSLSSQAILKTFNWAGKLITAKNDYLALYSSNLNGTKTDVYISTSAQLTTSIAKSGQITNLLTLTRKNLMPDAHNTNSRVFMRFFVPKGSKLLEAKGFDFLPIYRSEIDNSYKRDKDVLEWEKNSVRDVLTGTQIGLEQDKTFFGNWLSLKGGEEKTVSLKYTLPYKLKSLDTYSLLLQKQPGSQDYHLNQEFFIDNRELLWASSPEFDIKQSSPQHKYLLNKDHFFGIVLKTR